MTVVWAVLHALGSGLWMAFSMFWDTLWPLVFGFVVSGAVQAFVRRDELERALGNRHPRTLALSSLLGAASSSCSYAAAALAKSLFQKGADFVTAMVFMLASTNLVVELGLVLWVLMGWQFTLAEYVGGILMIALLALVSRFVLRPRLIALARRRVDEASAQHDHVHGGGAPGTEPLWRRLRSRSGWADAAGYTIADLRMLRRELLIGYLVAGFIAALVPTAVWNIAFFQGHGIWTVLENVLVGPLVAILSFVCSVGNVPLAAALWSGGLSFGGVVSFIFADLLTLPLLLIYRRYYGTRMTVQLLAVLWLVMSAAGLLTDGLFHLLDLIPERVPTTVAISHPAWNLTTVLNVIAIAVFLLVVWLSRQRERWGDGRYADDPTCGMQVEKRHAPAAAELDGETFFFCSDGCRDRFLATHREEERAPEGGDEATPAAGHHHSHTP